MGTQAQTTPFTLDNMGRYLCNTLTEAIDSTKASVSGRTRPFDVVIIGGGTFGSAMAAHLFENDPTACDRAASANQARLVEPHVCNCHRAT